MKKHLTWYPLLLVAFAFLSSACSSMIAANQDQELAASGTISARTVNVAPQLGGKVVSVDAVEGQAVTEGHVLFRLDDSLLAAQRRQAEATVQLAQQALNSAQIQYESTRNATHLQGQQDRVNNWNVSPPDEFELPPWYFNEDEVLASSQVEVAAAERDLANQKSNLEKVLDSLASQEFSSAESRVAEAQVAFLVATQLLTQTVSAQNNGDLVDYAQVIYDAAKLDLEAAQRNYNRLLTTKAAEDVLEARGRVEVAQERYDLALDAHNSQLKGDRSLQLKAAQAGVGQAEATLAQAQAALDVIDAQLEKTVISAPIDGTVLALNLDVGETLAPGGVVISIGQLDQVEIVVYIPETEYGKVKLGDPVSISVDSFPGKTFAGTVVHISDQAEFTPRNVQTVEGRRATVFAVKLNVPNPDQQLKPGMPADVIFATP